MPAKKQPILKQFNFQQYFKAQRLIADTTYVISPLGESYLLNGKNISVKQYEDMIPALVVSNPKGEGLDSRTNFY